MAKESESIRAFLGVGSNIDAEANILRALGLLRQRLDVIALSPFYRSRAVGTSAQPDFTNGVFLIETHLPARDLKLNVLRGLEAELGRRRTRDKNAARTIDLDLILYGDIVSDEPDFVLPDSGVRSYPFVALPLLALAPEITLPGSGERLGDLFPGQPADYGLVFLSRFSEELQNTLR
jgi:2-amino-4-hydroxy-6-hydroxymethyldihydropteridine diphosphokinase